VQLSDTAATLRGPYGTRICAYAFGGKIWRRAAVADPATFLLNSVQQRTGATLDLHAADDRRRTFRLAAGIGLK